MGNKTLLFLYLILTVDGFSARANSLSDFCTSVRETCAKIACMEVDDNFLKSVEQSLRIILSDSKRILGSDTTPVEGPVVRENDNLLRNLITILKKVKNPVQRNPVADALQADIEILKARLSIKRNLSNANEIENTEVALSNLEDLMFDKMPQKLSKFLASTSVLAYLNQRHNWMGGSYSASNRGARWFGELPFTPQLLESVEAFSREVENSKKTDTESLTVFSFRQVGDILQVSLKSRSRTLVWRTAMAMWVNAINANPKPTKLPAPTPPDPWFDD